MNADNAIADPAAKPVASPLPAQSAHFVRLDPLAPLGLRREACLHLHKPQVGCRRCRDACHYDCIELADGRLGVDAGRCTGCGRCASACPTAALAVDGFVLDALPASELVACHRQGRAGAGATAVPCLGGLDTFALLRLVERIAPAPLQLLDDGSCASCPNSAGTGHPGAALLAEVLPQLRGCGIAEAQMPVLHTLLPNGNGLSYASLSAKASGPNVVRRRFFAGLGRAVSGAVVHGSGALLAEAQALPSQPRNAVPYPRGDQTRRLLTRLAADTRPATAHLADVELAARCAAHQSCVRLCPTGALQSTSDGDRRSLRFDAWLCIACGVCATACPEGALRYSPPAERPFPATPVELARVELGACRRCGAEVAATPEALCPSCSRSESLARAGFALFAGRRPSPANAAGPP